jgi:uncharacterized iron-regulated protein
MFFYFLILATFFSQKPVSWKLFDKQGKESSYKKLVKEASKADVVLFGELHDNPIDHRLELQLAQDLYVKTDGKMMIGAEMLETDDQLPLDEYLSGKIEFKSIQNKLKLWPNFDTDYKPLLELAYEKHIPFYATNTPHRYAAFVARKGLDSLRELQPEALKLLPPLPVEVNLSLPGYKMLREMSEGPHATLPFMAEAQALKDATMAWVIAKNLEKGKVFLHINGTYHSNNYEGIYWYLKRKNPDLKIVTISSVYQNDIKEMDGENIGVADFILVSREGMAK